MKTFCGYLHVSLADSAIPFLLQATAWVPPFLPPQDGHHTGRPLQNMWRITRVPLPILANFACTAPLKFRTGHVGNDPHELHVVRGISNDREPP